MKPLKRLFSVHAFIHKGDCTKQVNIFITLLLIKNIQKLTLLCNICKMLFHYTGTTTLCTYAQEEEERLCRCVQSHKGESMWGDESAEFLG